MRERVEMDVTAIVGSECKGRKHIHVRCERVKERVEREIGNSKPNHKDMENDEAIDTAAEELVLGGCER